MPPANSAWEIQEQRSGTRAALCICYSRYRSERRRCSAALRPSLFSRAPAERLEPSCAHHPTRRNAGCTYRAWTGRGTPRPRRPAPDARHHVPGAPHAQAGGARLHHLSHQVRGGCPGQGCRLLPPPPPPPACRLPPASTAAARLPTLPKCAGTASSGRCRPSWRAALTSCRHAAAAALRLPPLPPLHARHCRCAWWLASGGPPTQPCASLL